MPGTKAGGRKAAATRRAKYGPHHYPRIARKAGRSGGATRGFASDKVGKDGLTGPERAKIVGSNAGKISRRAFQVEGPGAA